MASVRLECRNETCGGRLYEAETGELLEVEEWNSSVNDLGEPIFDTCHVCGETGEVVGRVED